MPTYCVVPVRNLHPKPGALSFAEAAAYPLVFATAWRMLMTQGAPAARRVDPRVGRRLGRGQRRRHAGLRARGERDRHGFTRRGARGGSRAGRPRDDQPPRRRRARRRYASSQAGAGADVVYEHVGADTWATSIEALRRGGRLVITGATTGGNPPARLHRIFWKQLDVLGSTMASDSEFRAVTRLFDQGRIRPLVDSVRPLEDVQDGAAAAGGRRAERQARARDRRWLRRIQTRCCWCPTAPSRAIPDRAAGRSCS